MQVFERIYKIKNGDNLGSPDTWNSRFKDIDLRLDTLEATEPKIDAAIQTIINTGIARIDQSFNPLIVDAQEKVAILDNLTFTKIDGGTF